MKIFLSWSGERTKPWISSKDIDKGSLWFGEINDQLKDTSVGIICLTQENKNRPWVLFESGALAKGLSDSRVCTFLVDLESKDIQDPLAQFNHTFPQKESMFALVKTLNKLIPTGSLDAKVLEQSFEIFWPRFEERFSKVLKSSLSSEPEKPRKEVDILGEILEITRSLNNRVRKIESDIDRGASGEAPGALPPPDYEYLNSALAAARQGISPRFLGDPFKHHSIAQDTLLGSFGDQKKRK
jgi:hypothetical protein